MAGAILSCGLILASWARAGSAPGQEVLPPVAPLPEGNTGIASKFFADAGIDKDPAVIFHDDFSSKSVSKWGKRRGKSAGPCIRFVEYPESVRPGEKAIEFTVPKTEDENGISVEKHFKPGLEVLFLRYYSKFDKGFDQIGSSHNGSYISASYSRNGRATPGEKADGKNKFLVGLENWRGAVKEKSPGELNFYCYHPDQRSGYGDHFYPSGKVTPFGEGGVGNRNSWGPNFKKRPEFVPELDRWYCYEFMVKANTPGIRDGRLAAWVRRKARR